MDLISVPPGRGAELDLDLEIEVDVSAATGKRRASERATSSWSNLELVNPNSKVLAPPLLPGLGADVFSMSFISGGKPKGRLAKLTRAHRIGIAAVAAVVVGAAGAWTLGYAIPAREARAVLAKHDAVALGGVHVEKAIDRAVRPIGKNERVGASPSDTSFRARPGPPAAGERTVALSSPAPAAAAKTGATTTAAREGDTGTSRRTKAKSSLSEPQDSAPVARPDLATSALEPRAPASSPAPAKAPSNPSPPPSDVDVTADFDRNAAMQALREAGDRARSCVVGANAANDVRVAVTFVRSGGVAEAAVEGPVAGTPTGECIAAKFRPLRIPPFRGSNMTVRKTITF